MALARTLAYHAAGRGHKIEDIQSEFEGDLNLRGLLDLDPKRAERLPPNPCQGQGQETPRAPSGQSLFPAGDIDEATIHELVRKSPVFDIVSNLVTVKVAVEKQ